ncbi:MAG: MOSC domain-containing protein [Thermoplasmata archaeon]|jgi:MOSC domain-containing protein YiiM|nr:MOSC domain-containing protein [Thermoplasmata archaeon]
MEDGREDDGTAAIVVSLNRALPREVGWRGRTVRTGFFKAPQKGPVVVGLEGLEGDASADTQAHGGPRQAVYAYPAEHYAFWADQLPDAKLPWGSFGENLTLRGLTEGRVSEGDFLEGSEVTLEVTHPRTPCYKMNLRFEREDMVRRFAAAGRSGYYLAVRQAGRLHVGERLIHRPVPGRGPSVAEVYRARMHLPPRLEAEFGDE